jgi:hypothetical protein
MSLKHSAEKQPAARPAAPAWGRVAKDGETARTLCLSVGERSVSYPADAIARWELSPGKPESLVIMAGHETVTLLGRKLVTIRDALNAGRLLEVKQQDDNSAENETAVSEIRFAVAD